MHVCVTCGHEQPSQSPCEQCSGRTVVVHRGNQDTAGYLLADRYVLLAHIGSGAMGAVHRAVHRGLQKLVAVKIMHTSSQASATLMQRFREEARYSSRLGHPHNVTVFDFGQTANGSAFLVMELIDGTPLSALELPLPPWRALRLALQICGALAEAHAIGLVHRDLKPPNVMISHVDGTEHATVLDYGIATLKNSTSRLTAEGHYVGTPTYIAPEQINNTPVDQRCDIYSLGVLLYEMCTGRPPFLSSDPFCVLYQHKSQRPPPPSAFVSLPDPVERLILQCLAKDPARRPPSAEAVRQQLFCLLADEDQPDQRLAGLGSNPAANTAGELELAEETPRDNRTELDLEDCYDPPVPTSSRSGKRGAHGRVFLAGAALGGVLGALAASLLLILMQPSRASLPTDEIPAAGHTLPMAEERELGPGPTDLSPTLDAIPPEQLTPMSALASTKPSRGEAGEPSQEDHSNSQVDSAYTIRLRTQPHNTHRSPSVESEAVASEVFEQLRDRTNALVGPGL